jgi:hypothetical protein
LVLISSNTQDRILPSEFVNYLELVFIKKIQIPTQHWFLKTTFHLHTYMGSSKFSCWKPRPWLEEYLHVRLSTWLIRRIWMEDKLD